MSVVSVEALVGAGESPLEKSVSDESEHDISGNKDRVDTDSVCGRKRLCRWRVCEKESRDRTLRLYILCEHDAYKEMKNFVSNQYFVHIFYGTQ